MSFLADRVFDEGLSVLSDEANRLDICSQEPTTYEEATSTYTLGNKANPSIGNPEDRSGGGKERSQASQDLVAPFDDPAANGRSDHRCT